MSLSEDDRFDHEGDVRVDEATRREADLALAQVNALRERFLLEASAFAAGVRAISPRLINRWEISTRSDSQTLDEAIAGFIQRVSENADDLVDRDEVERLTAISETGEDR